MDNLEDKLREEAQSLAKRQVDEQMRELRAFISNEVGWLHRRTLKNSQSIFSLADLFEALREGLVAIRTDQEYTNLVNKIVKGTRSNS